MKKVDARADSSLLTVSEGRLLRAGVPHRILSGSVHYFRVHPGQWRDRLERLAAMGLNTIDTYVPWNFHQPDEHEAASFSGWQDLRRFVTLAQAVGLDVVIRPGPYICAEWDNGGLPAWLTGRPGIRLRTSDPAFTDAVSRWFDTLIPQLVDLQSSNGGPIVAVQVENEYGSYGDDQAYLLWIRGALLSRGITELLYTADGPTDLMLDGGSVPGLLSAATFGSRPEEAAALIASRTPGAPFFAAEFWSGWFDHWGENHHTRETASASSTLRGILDLGGSVSIYMAHGGTNFGLSAGANHDGERFQPTVTSYDSDAPIAEDGRLSPKFGEFRDIFLAVTGAEAVPPPAPPAFLPTTTVPLTRGRPLLEALAATSEGRHSPAPLTFEELGLASGLVLYRADPVIPRGSFRLLARDLHDRAQVFVDGVPVGVLTTEQPSILVEGTGSTVALELLVENQGRINYGPLLGQGKGILGGVQLDRRFVHTWRSHPVPLDRWTPAEVAAAAEPGSSASPGAIDDNWAGFATGSFVADRSASAHLALPGFTKGFVWVNGFLLGRYWENGPQKTLYLPEPVVRIGRNDIVVLELERGADHLDLVDRPELGRGEEYVETF